MGPTATGKTDLAIVLAKQLDGEIISVDSAMVYRGMDIGTAKPTLEERDGIVHHLIDIIEPEAVYSAAQFFDDVAKLVPEILARSRVPILTGGTMMYFNALFKGLSNLPAADPAIRAHIEAQAERLGWPAMHAQLDAIDPVAGARIKPTDPQRITRALEVYEICGENLTTLCEHNAQKPLPYPIHRIALIPASRENLHQRIELRFELMLKRGFIDEVKQLYSRPCLEMNLPAIRCVGYRQVWQYLDGEYGYDVMKDRGIVATRQLAKRQMTWLRGMEGVTSFFYDDEALMRKVTAHLKSSKAT